MKKLDLKPEHLSDLRKSGLTDDTILEAGIKSIPPERVEEKLGFGINSLASAYVLPYPGTTTYCRYKAFYAAGQESFPDGRTKPKYLTRKSAGNRLYIPPTVRPILDNPTIPLYITEGEKKSLKTCQEGINCIAISGLWNWKVRDEYELILDFNEVTWDSRTVYLVPDNDFLNPNRKGDFKNLKQAVHELAYLLIDRGAKVFWVELPVGDEKIGLDDYLLLKTVEEFKKLPAHEIRKLTIKKEIEELNPDEANRYDLDRIIKRIAKIKSETEKSLYIKELSDKLGVSKRAIQKDIESVSNNGKADSCQAMLSANIPGLIDVAADDSGNTAYVIKTSTTLQVVTSWELEKVIYAPPDKGDLPFNLPRANEVLRWYQSDDDRQLFSDLIAYFKRFSYLPDNSWLIVACKVLLTYIQDHPDVYYLPELLFWAVPERGKSRTGKAIVNVCFRGIHLVELREANLFRYSQDMQATLFFDIMNLWKKAERNNTEDILLLRFEKGAKASRVLYPEKGAFKDMVHYDIYGPTIIATNEAVHKILDTRCIPITMPNKPGDYEKPTPEKAQELKERLIAWRTRVMNNPLPEVDAVSAISGRLWDISKPLLQVCKLVSPQRLQALKETLLDIAGQRLEDKKAGIEWQIISTLHELSQDEESIPEWQIASSKVLEHLNRDRPEGKKLTPQYLGRKLRAMGIKTRRLHGYSEVLLTRAEFDVLLVQFGIIDSPPCSNSLPNSTTLKSQLKSTTCGGRELVESGGNSTNSLPGQVLENQEPLSLVESGRELSHSPEEIFFDDNLMEVAI